MLATWVETPPAGAFHYEIKLDGYRLLTQFSGKNVLAHTRNGIDYTEKLGGIVEALAGLRVTGAYLDGEIVVFDERGISRFSLLQQALSDHASSSIRYVVFDILCFRGRDLRSLPIETRRARLQDLLAHSSSSLLVGSTWVDRDPLALLQAARASGYEGLVGKRVGSSYVSGRSRDWIKLTFDHRQEGIVVGFTPPRGTRSGFGALLLAVHEDHELRYIGRVGTGFSETTLRALHRTLEAIRIRHSPLPRPPVDARNIRWVEPVLIVDVEHAGFTAAGMLRKAAFVGLRPDRNVDEIVRQEPLSMPPAPSPASTTEAGITITHGDRVIDAKSGATKHDLARFYATVAPQLLPHLAHRPVALLRAPDGVTGETFFQKHAAGRTIPGVRQMDPALDPGHAPLLAIDNVQALVGVVQMGTIELHTWNARETRIERPDRMIFDLDPDPKLPFPQVRQAASLMRDLLQELGLTAFVKTSGGAGLHVVVPLTPHADWDSVKTFSRMAAEHMARTLPKLFVAKSGEKNRVRRIFVDYLRNGRGSSTVSAFSVRARAGLPVSMPVSWELLETLEDPLALHIHSVPDWLAQHPDDPWMSYRRIRQRLTKRMHERLRTGEPT